MSPQLVIYKVLYTSTNYYTCPELTQSREEQLIQTNPKTVHMLVLADKDFKAAIINMLKEWKENVFK